MRVERVPCPRCGSLLTSAGRRRDLRNDIVAVHRVCSRCTNDFVVGYTTDLADLLRGKVARLRVTAMKQIERNGAASEQTRRRLEEAEDELHAELLRHGLDA